MVAPAAVDVVSLLLENASLREENEDLLARLNEWVSLCLGNIAASERSKLELIVGGSLGSLGKSEGGGKVEP